MKKTVKNLLDEKAKQSKETYKMIEKTLHEIVGEISQRGSEMGDEIYFNQSGLSCWTEREIPISVSGPMELSMRTGGSVVTALVHLESGKTLMTVYLKGKIGLQFIQQYHKNLEVLMGNLIESVKASSVYEEAKGSWVPVEKLVPDFYVSYYCPGPVQKVGKSPSSFTLVDLDKLDTVSHVSESGRITLEIKTENKAIFMKVTEQTSEEEITLLSDQDREMIRSVVETAEWRSEDFNSVSALIPTENRDNTFKAKLVLYFEEMDQVPIINQVRFKTLSGDKTYLKVSVSNKLKISDPAF